MDEVQDADVDVVLVLLIDVAIVPDVLDVELVVHAMGRCAASGGAASAG